MHLEIPSDSGYNGRFVCAPRGSMRCNHSATLEDVLLERALGLLVWDAMLLSSGEVKRELEGLFAGARSRLKKANSVREFGKVSEAGVC